ncbi:MAG TPA: AAA family ATPase [Thermoanaerobaculia bacterium]|nr:AAA family ATPase [Thermoanaerobaculia bacterium]
MSAETTWQEANQRYLTAALALVSQALERHAERAPHPPGPPLPSPSHPPGEGEMASLVEQQRTGGGAPLPADGGAMGEGSGVRSALDEATAAMPAPSALEIVVRRFGLSPFERDVLLLAAGPELDSAFAVRCTKAQGDPARRLPTFSLALAALPDAHWSALLPSAPLRHWRLVEPDSRESLTVAPLRIDERILHHLAGLRHLDERLTGLVRPLPEPEELIPSHRELAERIAKSWTESSGRDALPAIQLCGADSVTCRTIAAAACALLGLDAYVLSAAVVPTAPVELDGLIRLWEREAVLSGGALLIDAEDLDGSSDPAREAAVSRLLDETRGAVLLAARDRRRARQRPLLTFDVQRPTSAERRGLWETALQGVLNGGAETLNGHLDAVVTHFELSPVAIRSVGARLATAEGPLGDALWDACRTQARPRLEGLAQRIEAKAAWDDLVLPEPQRHILREIAIHVRRRHHVYEAWGFANRLARGLGINALFTGASGTGKTMAAEVLANELRLDLYRIDLSSVVSKYIGETEKNLRRVFDAAEEGGGILLFDEADALFGKRSEVKDSHDRYANIEVSYLLQRMESYGGLAVLTTNLKDALDQAFLRRLRFVVQFPFPDPTLRAEIWRRIFPPQTPVEGLNHEKLARLNIAGGNIRNIALNAAFLAAEDDQPVKMDHLLRAARGEYAKMEKPLAETELRGWVG